MKPAKTKVTKVYSRMQAERAMTSGEVRPEAFLSMKNPLQMVDPKNPGACPNHRNWHVLKKAWKMMGCPTPDLSAEDMVKFNKLLRIKTEEPVAPAATSVAVEEVGR